jgi:hypothetical protein
MDLLGLAILIEKNRASPNHERQFDEQCLYIENILERFSKEENPKSTKLAHATAHRLLILLKDPAWHSVAIRPAWQSLITSCHATIDKKTAGTQISVQWVLLFLFVVAGLGNIYLVYHEFAVWLVQFVVQGAFMFSWIASNVLNDDTIPATVPICGFGWL